MSWGYIHFSYLGEFKVVQLAMFDDETLKILSSR